MMAFSILLSFALAHLRWREDLRRDDRGPRLPDVRVLVHGDSGPLDAAQALRVRADGEAEPVAAAQPAPFTEAFQGMDDAVAASSPAVRALLKQRRGPLVLLGASKRYRNLTDQMVHTFRALNMSSFLILCEDQDCIADQKIENVLNVRRARDAVGGQWGSAELNRISSMRPLWIWYFLQLGLDVVYTDSDIVWAWNFLTKMFLEMKRLGVEVALARDGGCDDAEAETERLRSAWEERAAFSTGFVAARASSHFAAGLMEAWAAELHDPQGAFQRAEHAFCRSASCGRLRAVPLAFVAPGCVADALGAVGARRASGRTGLERKRAIAMPLQGGSPDSAGSYWGLLRVAAAFLCYWAVAAVVVACSLCASEPPGGGGRAKRWRRF